MSRLPKGVKYCGQCGKELKPAEIYPYKFNQVTGVFKVKRFYVTCPLYTGHVLCGHDRWMWEELAGPAKWWERVLVWLSNLLN